jgi:hypothetical protein
MFATLTHNDYILSHPPPRIKRAVDRSSSNKPKTGKNTLIFKLTASFFDKKTPFDRIRFFVGHYSIFRRTMCEMNRQQRIQLAAVDTGAGIREGGVTEI